MSQLKQKTRSEWNKLPVDEVQSLSKFITIESHRPKWTLLYFLFTFVAFILWIRVMWTDCILKRNHIFITKTNIDSIQQLLIASITFQLQQFSVIFFLTILFVRFSFLFFFLVIVFFPHVGWFFSNKMHFWCRHKVNSNLVRWVLWFLFCCLFEWFLGLDLSFFPE